jgi:predicted unusual protein kinase regulating ubiquinone biosynthesis (AarF/ABC1/UbiB family)
MYLYSSNPEPEQFPTRLRWAKATISTLRIAKIYIFYKFFSPKHSEQKSTFYKNLGNRIQIECLRLGGAYIKLGQFLSTLSHILPLEFTNELASLQDRVAPHSIEKIASRIYAETKTQISELFQSFHPDPIASASTAQVHIAYLNDEKVAVKVLYPNIENIMKRDIRFIHLLLKFINYAVIPLPANQIHDQFKKLIYKELDLQNELAYLLKSKELFKNESHIFVPDPILSHCYRGMLVTKFIDGVKITDYKQEGSTQSQSLKLLFRSYTMMVFQSGFFHADPHPGNLLVTPEGNLCLLDFGATEDLSLKEMNCIKNIITCAFRKEYYGVLEALKDMDSVPKNISDSQMVQIIKHGIEKINRILIQNDHFLNMSFETFEFHKDLDLLKDLDLGFKDLFSHLNLPSHFIALQRVLALLVGLTAQIDPKHSIFFYANDPFQELVWGGSHWKSLIREQKEEFFKSFLFLPNEMYRYLYNQNHGFINKGDYSQKEQNSLSGFLHFFQCIFFILVSTFFWDKNQLLFYAFIGLGIVSYFQSWNTKRNS